MFCVKCGKEIRENMKFCTNCGADLSIQFNKSKQVNTEEYNTSEKANNIPEVSKNNISEAPKSSIPEIPKNNISDGIKDDLPELPRKVIAAEVNSSSEEPKKVSNESNKKSKFGVVGAGIGSLISLAAVIFLVMAIMGKFDNLAYELTNGAFGKGADYTSSEKKRDSDEKKEENTSDFSENSDEIVAKKEDGSTVTDFKKINDRLYVSADYEDEEFQCPYEVILEQKNLKLYDKVCLIEHLVKENEVYEDADGNIIKPVEGITHYYLDVVRVMCEYTSKDGMFKIKEYYNLAMSNFAQEKVDEWSLISSTYINDNKEVDFSNLNDTYWKIDDNDVCDIGRDGLMNNEVYVFDAGKMTAYIHFINLDKVVIDNISSNGTLEINSDKETEIGKVKVLYEDECFEGTIMAGGINAIGFLKTNLNEISSLEVELGVHSYGGEYSQGVCDTFCYLEKSSDYRYNQITQVTKDDFDNVKQGAVQDNNQADNKDEFEKGTIISEAEILFRVVVDNSDGYVNLRSNPSKYSDIIVEIPNGDILDIIDVSGDWLGVSDGTGIGGWVHSSQVSVDDENEDEYMLYGSDSEYLDEEVLNGFGAWECKIARNEIYARHGRMFKDSELQAYFESKAWYTPVYTPEEFDESVLNECELANRDMIVNYEKKMGYR